MTYLFNLCDTCQDFAGFSYMVKLKLIQCHQVWISKDLIGCISEINSWMYLNINIVYTFVLPAALHQWWFVYENLQFITLLWICRWLMNAFIWLILDNFNRVPLKCATCQSFTVFWEFLQNCDVLIQLDKRLMSLVRSCVKMILLW